MNLEELRNGLLKLSDLKFEQFVNDLGGGHKDREAVVRTFVDKPDLERRLCQLLNIPTEAEKMVQATLDAASSAKRSANVATIASAIALISLVVTIYGILK